MEILAIKSRNIDTSIFINKPIPLAILTLCIIGFTFTLLVFLQNYMEWVQRNSSSIKKYKNKDLLNSFLLCSILIAILIYIGIKMFTILRQ